MAFISLKKYKINVDIVPNLFPRDVVFLHGNLSSNIWWQPAIQAWQKKLSQANATAPLLGRAILVEWRGCGQTTGPESEPRVSNDLAPQQLAQDLIETVHALKLEKFDLVGHSYGGLISLMAAVRAPELIDKLVLLDSVGAHGVQFPKEGRDAFLQMKVDREFCATVMSGTIHGCDIHSPLFNKIVDDAMGVSPLVWTAIPDVLNHVDIVKDIEQFKRPTLVIHGDQDPVLPKADSEALAKWIPNATYREFKGNGHSPNVESPELFASTVSEFLFADAR